MGGRRAVHNKKFFAGFMHKFGYMAGSAWCGWIKPFLAAACRLRSTTRNPITACLVPAAEAKKIDYPKPDNQITFDRLSSVFLSNTNHEEDQPCHLTLKDAAVPIRDNLPMFDEPAQRYCPAGVMKLSKTKRASGSRSTRRIAFTARPVTSRTRRRISTG
jgi:electron-transferring-flavoprotein dehydrogenase